MIAAFVLHLISQVKAAIIAGIPFRLSGIHFIRGTVGSHLIIDGIKQIKFKFRADQHLIRRTGGLHILHSPQGHIPGILIKRLVFLFPDHTYIAGHGKRGYIHKGIYDSAFRIRDKYHIALFYRRIPVIRTVKADPVFKNTLSEPFHRYGDMPETPVQIHHFKIDHTDVVFPAHLQDFFAFFHK